MKNLAIIGAGFSGTLIADLLSKQFKVTIFEKARGVGGRMATRFADPFYFDHGAQCFTARTPAFKEFVAEMVAKNLVAEWFGRIINIFPSGAIQDRQLWESHYVACPNMNSICKYFALNKNIILQKKVTKLEQNEKKQWKIFLEQEEYPELFDFIIATAPPVQTIELLEKFLVNDNPINNIQMHSTYSLMLGFKNKIALDWVAAKVINNPIKWVSVNSTKPQRNKDYTTFILQSANNWTKQNINLDPQKIQNILLNEFAKIFKIDIAKVDYANNHFWRYSIIKKSYKSGPYINYINNFGMISDWCNTSRIEEIWLSATELVRLILIKYISKTN